MSGEIQSATNWTEVACSLNISAKYPKAEFLMVLITGKDNQFWAGHYGAKFSRISVSVNCLDRTKENRST